MSRLTYIWRLWFRRGRARPSLASVKADLDALAREGDAGVQRLREAFEDGLRTEAPAAAVVHTIPVPHGWSVEQAWEAISRGDRLTDKSLGWANVEIVGGHLVRVLRSESE